MAKIGQFDFAKIRKNGSAKIRFKTGFDGKRLPKNRIRFRFACLLNSDVIVFQILQETGQWENGKLIGRVRRTRLPSGSNRISTNRYGRPILPVLLLDFLKRLSQKPEVDTVQYSFHITNLRYVEINAIIPNEEIKSPINFLNEFIQT